MIQTIYKICGGGEWDKAVAQGNYTGSPDDIRDGFIHFSTAAQVPETAAKYFAGRSDLMLVAVATAKLEADLKWEKSRGGQLFPHLYAPLSLTAVAWFKRIHLGSDGAHCFPEEMI